MKRRLALAAGIAALAIVTTAGVAMRGEGESADALRGYETTLDPLAYDAGRVVVQGLRAEIADLRYARRSSEEVADMARGWRSELDGLRRRMAALDPPEFLEENARLIDEAMASYVSTADALIDAAHTEAAERAQAIDDVGASGEHADEVWDRALSLIDDERRRLGITEPSPLDAPSPSFLTPNPGL